MFKLNTSFKPLWSGGGGEVIMITNSKEENSDDFCPTYVQEFGLSTVPEHSEERRKSVQFMFLFKNKCTKYKVYPRKHLMCVKV